MDIEITANTIEDFKNLEQWLFNLTPPKEVTGACIYCHENQKSYFYKVREEFGNNYFVTDGEC